MGCLGHPLRGRPAHGEYFQTLPASYGDTVYVGAGSAEETDVAASSPDQADVTASFYALDGADGSVQWERELSWASSIGGAQTGADYSQPRLLDLPRGTNWLVVHGLPNTLSVIDPVRDEVVREIDAAAAGQPHAAGNHVYLNSGRDVAVADPFAGTTTVAESFDALNSLFLARGYLYVCKYRDGEFSLLSGAGPGL